jgi:autotransporter-associated beta strand protein
MKSSHDPDLTSWALNELSPAERAAYEEELKKNPALQAEAQTTQNFCRFVQNHLCDDKAAFTASQRERLKAAAGAGSLQIRDERKPHGNVIQAKPRQWWQRPAFVLPLSAAAAIVLGFLPYLSNKMSPDHSNTGTATEMAATATATPKTELEGSVLSPATTSEPSGSVASQQFAAVEAKPASTSGATNVMKSRSGTAIFSGITSETGAALTNGVTTLAKIGSGGVVRLTGINTYTGGLAVNGGVLLAGLSNTPASSNYLGEPTNTRGTMTERVGRLNRATGGSISELADLSDISEMANIMVNGGVSR